MMVIRANKEEEFRVKRKGKKQNKKITNTIKFRTKKC
jgi:hypothetical protein